jgi:DNA mismatch repair protein MLH3
MTSKCHTVDDINTHLKYFGYRGEAIASIVVISGTVELCSRHKLSQNTYSKLFHNGKAMPVTASKSHRPSVGTTASVHDFFYNLPVRKNGISAALELEKVKRIVESIALLNPSISFSMRNDATGECILHTHKTDSVMHRFGLLFGRDKATAMKDVSLSQDGLELSGFMSTEGHHNKSLQFVYVNGRIVKKTLLHSHVNDILANSLLSRKLSRVAESNMKKEQKGAIELLSPRCTPGVFGVYVLHIKCPISEYDICLEPAKTLIEFKDWDRIMSAVEELVQDFLFKNNLTLALIHPAAPNSVQDQQEDHQLSTSSMITEDRNDVSPHLPANNVIENSTLAPCIKSRTIRRPHLLASASSKQIKQGNSYLPKYVHMPGFDMDMMESKCMRTETPGTEPDGDNHTTRTTCTPDDDHPVQEELPNSSAIQANMLPILPPCAHSESTYHGQDGGERLVTHPRLLNCLCFSEKQCKQPTAYNDEINSNDAAMCPARTCCQQYPSSSLFLSTYSCIPKHSMYTCSTSGGHLMHTSHMQNDGVNSSKDSGNIATCASFKSSIEPSNTQDHSPLTHISYRSPLQSSISSKLSELFRSNPKKNELTSTSSFREKMNIAYQHPPPTSRVSCQSVSLEWKRSESSHNAMNLDADLAHSKLPHGENILSPQSPPLTSSVASTDTRTYTSSYMISKPEFSCNGVYPLFTYAPSDVNCIPTTKHSQVSTTSTLEGRPLSLGVCNTKPIYSLTLPSESATASWHILCSMESTSSFSKNTTIINQKDDIEDEHSIQNTDFTNEVTSVAQSLSFDSKKPVWKEVTDPATGRTLYMHSKSGNCVSSLPYESSASSEIYSIFKDSRHDSLRRGLLDNSSFISYSSSMDVTGGLSNSLDTELSSHHQKPDCHRISLNTDRNFTSNSDLSISSLLADHQPQMELLATKWRHQSELTEISSIHGCETANYTSFDDIFKGWKNPTFQGGEEVS